VEKVLEPTRNKKDLVEINKKVLRDLNIIYVDEMDDVIAHALAAAGTLRSVSPRAKSRAKTTTKTTKVARQPKKSRTSVDTIPAPPTG
jgi:predicted ATP-dependent protease